MKIHTRATRTVAKMVLSVSMMVFELDDFAVALALALAPAALPDAAAAWTPPANVDAGADAEVLTVGVALLVLALEVLPFLPELEPERPEPDEDVLLATSAVYDPRRAPKCAMTASESRTVIVAAPLLSRTTVWPLWS